MKIGVIGCGAWAITIAKILHENDHSVTVWCHSQATLDDLHDTRSLNALPGVTLPEFGLNLRLEDVVDHADELVLGVASDYVDIIETLPKSAYQNKAILCLTKGMLQNRKTLFVADYIQETIPNSKVAVLSGPNLAREIAEQKPAATVIASDDKETAVLFQKLVSNHYLRAYVSDDVKGVILGGILKNSIAIAAGCCEGLNLGTNAKSSLITRGLQEMIRFGLHYGAKEETFFGLSGLGDLVTTCNSTQSRNFRVGLGLAEKKDLDDILTDLQAVAEGVKTTKVVYQLAQEKQIEMPIVQQVYRVLYHHEEPEKALQTLMLRRLKSE